MLDVSRRQVARAVRVAADTRPDVEAESQVEIGAPIEVLSSEARRAQLLVLGDRGLGEVAGLVLGSVAVSLAARGACPVVVVRGERAGADGPWSSGSTARRSARPRWRSPSTPPRPAAWTWWPCTRGRRPRSTRSWRRWSSGTRSAESAVLAERLAGWGQKYPQVAVRRTVVRDGAVRALVDGLRGSAAGGGGVTRSRQRGGPAARLGQPRCPARRPLPGRRRPPGHRQLITGVGRRRGGAVVVADQHVAGDPLGQRDPARAERARPGGSGDVAHGPGEGVGDVEVVRGLDLPAVAVEDAERAELGLERGRLVLQRAERARAGRRSSAASARSCRSRTWPVPREPSRRGARRRTRRARPAPAARRPATP